MGVFDGTERQCTEDEHDDEDENDSQISEFGLNRLYATGKMMEPNRSAVRRR